MARRYRKNDDESDRDALIPPLDAYGSRAWEEIEESVEITAKFTDMVTTRGLALGDGGTLQTLQQAAGRIGGQTSGAVRREERDDERDDDPDQ